jgi:hypothetical protein
LVAHVGAKHRDLVQSRRAQGGLRRIGMPDRDAHTRPFGGEAQHEPSAEEPRAAEHGNRSHGIACGILDQVVMAFVLSRNIQIEPDLVDQLFNSSERRLARLLLLLANFGKEGKMEKVHPSVSQDILAARWYDALADQFLHEQVSQTWVH